MLLYEYKYSGSDSATFIDKVNNVAYRLGIDPNWLMYILDLESGLNPSATNNSYTYSDGTHAVGLNQMTTKAFEHIGYTGSWQDFRNLSGTEQMEWIYKYFKEFSGRINNFKDLYLINFYPAYLGKDPSTQFPYSVVRGNPIFDVNGDGNLTLGELYAYLDSRARQNVPSQFMDSFFNPQTNEVAQWNFVQTHKRDIVITILIIAIISIMLFLIYLIFRK